MPMLLINKAAAAVRPSARHTGSCRVVRPFTAAPNSSSRQMVKVNFFKFGNKGAQEAVVAPTAGRDEYQPEDVEHYFNYTGMLATEGTYDRLEAMLNSGVAPIDLILLMAVQEGDTFKVEELIEAGADLSVENLDGKTALDLATKPEIIDMLKAKL